MPKHNELRRIVDGASLVLLEALKRSAPGAGSKGGDFQTLVSHALKNALISVTDLAGITSGKLHQFSNPNPHSTQGSVVYFSHSSPDSSSSSSSPSPVSSPPPPSLQQSSAPSSVSPPHPLHSHPETTVANAAVVLEDQFQNDGHSIATSVKPNANTETIHSDQIEQLIVGSTKNSTAASSSASNDIPSKRNRRRPRERRVPSTPLGRALGFAGLGAGLAWGTLQESAKRLVYGTPSSTEKQSAISPFLSEQNAERLALALCRMRGAALKLGQMLSIQDETLIPAPILAALDIVRQGADVMPRGQLNDVLDAELGPDWSNKLKSFDYEPLAAASIGQVHRAVMKDDLEVAMKIQYPSVADSIDSDIENVRRLLDYTNLIPKGLFLDRAIKVAKEELSRECDYELEAKNQKRFRELLSKTEGVYVPMVIDDISSRKILTTELVTGIPIDKVAVLSLETRNYVGRKLLELTLKELFVFRFMQTDPNWSNFLYDEATNMINLIDFGAAREYRKGFVDDYLRMVLACANRDRDAVIEMSTRLGFLTGMESEVMLDAHVEASFIVGLPFSTSGPYDFRSSDITSSISHLGATMLKHRLTPPPDEAYSLHRKLSGAFLACIKLGVAVPCRDLLLQVYQQYRFSDENEETAPGSVS